VVSLKILVSGLAGTGKTTLCRRLASEFELEYYSGGDALKEVASRLGYKVSQVGWWESEEGLRFLRERRERLELDREVDRHLLMKVKAASSIVVDGWALPYLYDGKDAVKVFLKGELEVRAERVARRDGITVSEALEAIRRKEEMTREIYRELYGFTIGRDLEPFNLVVDTSRLTADQVFYIVKSYIQYFFERDS